MMNSVRVRGTERHKDRDKIVQVFDLIFYGEVHICLVLLVLVHVSGRRDKVEYDIRIRLIRQGEFNEHWAHKRQSKTLEECFDLGRDGHDPHLWDWQAGQEPDVFGETGLSR